MHVALIFFDPISSNYIRIMLVTYIQYFPTQHFFPFFDLHHDPLYLGHAGKVDSLFPSHQPFSRF